MIFISCTVKVRYARHSASIMSLTFDLDSAASITYNLHHVDMLLLYDSFYLSSNPEY